MNMKTRLDKLELIGTATWTPVTMILLIPLRAADTPSAIGYQCNEYIVTRKHDEAAGQALDRLAELLGTISINTLLMPLLAVDEIY